MLKVLPNTLKPNIIISFAAIRVLINFDSSKSDRPKAMMMKELGVNGIATKINSTAALRPATQFKAF